MSQNLKVLIHGSGFAGQGHAEAFRAAGTEVVGMVSRTAEVVNEVASRMGIPYAGTDWEEALNALCPDIVAIGTPGGAHIEPISDALTRGCHVYCDKPLAATAVEARAIYEKARDAGVKTAYAASYCYQPNVLFAETLFREGVLGELQEIECVSHFNLNPLIPWHWSHSRELGGGRLNNNFTHKLAIALRVSGGVLLQVTGETRNDMPRAPFGPHPHDFRNRELLAPTPEQAATMEWREADAEWSYTVLARIGDVAVGPTKEVSALFKHSALQPAFHEDYIAFFGSAGAIHIPGVYASGALQLFRQDVKQWETLDTPTTILAGLPAMEDPTIRNWTQLAREFVDDIEGRASRPYLSFKEGWLFQEVIEAVRQGRVWTPPAM